MRAQLISLVCLLVLFPVLLSSAGYAQKLIPVDTSKTVILRVDPANAMGGNASEIFEGVDYIPLETTLKQQTPPVISNNLP